MFTDWNDIEEKIETQVSFIRDQLEDYLLRDWSICVSSSFQTHSIPLLHILTRLDRNVAVYFLDTGFHFPETLAFRDEVAKLLDIQVLSVKSSVPKIAQLDAAGQFLYVNDPDRCCHLNKVLPMEFLTHKHKVWVSGVRRDQSAVRKNFAVEVPGPNGSVRFHPMLDWDSRMVYHYSKMHGLPKHPLDAKGFVSIGCVPCTAKPGGDERDGRWLGLQKTECGLHTQLVGK